MHLRTRIIVCLLIQVFTTIGAEERNVSTNKQLIKLYRIHKLKEYLNFNEKVLKNKNDISTLNLKENNDKTFSLFIEKVLDRKSNLQYSAKEAETPRSNNSKVHQEKYDKFFFQLENRKRTKRLTRRDSNHWKSRLWVDKKVTNYLRQRFHRNQSETRQVRENDFIPFGRWHSNVPQETKESEEEETEENGTGETEENDTEEIQEYDKGETYEETQENDTAEIQENDAGETTEVGSKEIEETKSEETISNTEKSNRKHSHTTKRGWENSQQAIENTYNESRGNNHNQVLHHVYREIYIADKRRPHYENLCPKDGYFPDLYSCEMFHFCNRGHISYYKCNKYYRYDPSSGTCKTIQIQKCFKFECYRKRDRQVPFHGNPQIYANCHRNKPFLIRSCPDGSIFIEEIQKCLEVKLNATTEVPSLTDSFPKYTSIMANFNRKDVNGFSDTTHPKLNKPENIPNENKEIFTTLTYESSSYKLHPTATTQNAFSKTQTNTHLMTSTVALTINPEISGQKYTNYVTTPKEHILIQNTTKHNNQFYTDVIKNQIRPPINGSNSPFDGASEKTVTPIKSREDIPFETENFPLNITPDPETYIQNLTLRNYSTSGSYSQKQSGQANINDMMMPKSTPESTKNSFSTVPDGIIPLVRTNKGASVIRGKIKSQSSTTIMPKITGSEMIKNYKPIPTNAFTLYQTNETANNFKSITQPKNSFKLPFEKNRSTVSLRVSPDPNGGKIIPPKIFNDTTTTTMWLTQNTSDIHKILNSNTEAPYVKNTTFSSWEISMQQKQETTNIRNKNPQVTSSTITSQNEITPEFSISYSGTSFTKAVNISNKLNLPTHHDGNLIYDSTFKDLNPHKVTEILTQPPHIKNTELLTFDNRDTTANSLQGENPNNFNESTTISPVVTSTSVLPELFKTTQALSSITHNYLPKNSIDNIHGIQFTLSNNSMRSKTFKPSNIESTFHKTHLEKTTTASHFAMSNKTFSHSESTISNRTPNTINVEALTTTNPKETSVLVITTDSQLYRLKDSPQLINTTHDSISMTTNLGKMTSNITNQSNETPHAGIAEDYTSKMNVTAYITTPIIFTNLKGEENKNQEIITNLPPEKDNAVHTSTTRLSVSKSTTNSLLPAEPTEETSDAPSFTTFTPISTGISSLLVTNKSFHNIKNTQSHITEYYYTTSATITPYSTGDSLIQDRKINLLPSVLNSTPIRPTTLNMPTLSNENKTTFHTHKSIISSVGTGNKTSEMPTNPNIFNVTNNKIKSTTLSNILGASVNESTIKENVVSNDDNSGAHLAEKTPDWQYVENRTTPLVFSSTENNRSTNTPNQFDNSNTILPKKSNNTSNRTHLNNLHIAKITTVIPILKTAIFISRTDDNTVSNKNYSSLQKATTLSIPNTSGVLHLVTPNSSMIKQNISTTPNATGSFFFNKAVHTIAKNPPNTQGEAFNNSTTVDSSDINDRLQSLTPIVPLSSHQKSSTTPVQSTTVSYGTETSAEKSNIIVTTITSFIHGNSAENITDIPLKFNTTATAMKELKTTSQMKSTTSFFNNPENVSDTTHLINDIIIYPKNDNTVSNKNDSSLQKATTLSIPNTSGVLHLVTTNSSMIKQNISTTPNTTESLFSNNTVHTVAKNSPNTQGEAFNNSTTVDSSDINDRLQSLTPIVPLSSHQKSNTTPSVQSTTVSYGTETSAEKSNIIVTTITSFIHGNSAENITDIHLKFNTAATAKNELKTTSQMKSTTSFFNNPEKVSDTTYLTGNPQRNKTDKILQPFKTTIAFPNMNVTSLNSPKISGSISDKNSSNIVNNTTPANNMKSTSFELVNSTSTYRNIAGNTITILNTTRYLNITTAKPNIAPTIISSSSGRPVSENNDKIQLNDTTSVSKGANSTSQFMNPTTNSSGEMTNNSTLFVVTGISLLNETTSILTSITTALYPNISSRSDSSKSYGDTRHGKMLTTSPDIPNIETQSTVVLGSGLSFTRPNVAENSSNLNEVVNTVSRNVTYFVNGTEDISLESKIPLSSPDSTANKSRAILSESSTSNRIFETPVASSQVILRSTDLLFTTTSSFSNPSSHSTPSSSDILNNTIKILKTSKLPISSRSEDYIQAKTNKSDENPAFAGTFSTLSYNAISTTFSTPQTTKILTQKRNTTYISGENNTPNNIYSFVPITGSTESLNSMVSQSTEYNTFTQSNISSPVPNIVSTTSQINLNNFPTTNRFTTPMTPNTSKPLTDEPDQRPITVESVHFTTENTPTKTVLISDTTTFSAETNSRGDILSSSTIDPLLSETKVVMPEDSTVEDMYKVTEPTMPFSTTQSTSDGFLDKLLDTFKNFFG